MIVNTYLNQHDARVSVIQYEDNEETDEGDPIDLTVGMLISILQTYDPSLPVGIDYPIEAPDGSPSMHVGGRVVAVMQNGEMVDIGTGVDIT